jgi:hypothetical protein
LSEAGERNRVKRLEVAQKRQGKDRHQWWLQMVDHHTHPHKVGDKVHVAKKDGISSATVVGVCVGSDVTYTVGTKLRTKGRCEWAIGSVELRIPVIRMLHPTYRDAPIVWSEGLYQRYNTVELVRYGMSKKLLVQVLPSSRCSK